VLSTAAPLRVKIGPRREHAMVVCRRGPYLKKAAFGHQALGRTVFQKGLRRHRLAHKDGAHHFNFAGPGITCLPTSLSSAACGSCPLACLAAPKGTGRIAAPAVRLPSASVRFSKSASVEIGLRQRRLSLSSSRDRVAHGYCAAGVPPLIRLQVKGSYSRRYQYAQGIVRLGRGAP
jgi:hypothetical protein